jgi:hypothetical protein
VKDDIVDPIRKVREQLIDGHGGIDGYFKYCQAQERALLTRGKRRRTRKRPLPSAAKQAKLG